METNPAFALLFHQGECKLAARSAQTFQCFHQQRNDIRRQIHQESFSDPKCPFSWIEAVFDQSVSIESSGVQVNRDEMQSSSAKLGQRAQFLTLCRRMIELPKFRVWKIQL